MLKTSVGSTLSMDKAYIDESKAQAVCCWNAPNLTEVENLFAKAGIATASIQEVVEFIPEPAGV